MINIEIQCFSFYYCQIVGPVLKKYNQIDFIMEKIMNYVIYNKWQGLFQNKKNIFISRWNSEDPFSQ